MVEVPISFSGHLECSRVQFLLRSHESCMRGKGGERIHGLDMSLFSVSSHAPSRFAAVSSFRAASGTEMGDTHFQYAFS